MVSWFLGPPVELGVGAAVLRQTSVGFSPSPKALSLLALQDGRAGARRHPGTRALQELEPAAPGEPPRGLPPHPAPADPQRTGEAHRPFQPASQLHGASQLQTQSSATLIVQCRCSESTWVPGADQTKSLGELLGVQGETEVSKV